MRQNGLMARLARDDGGTMRRDASQSRLFRLVMLIGGFLAVAAGVAYSGYVLINQFILQGRVGTPMAEQFPREIRDYVCPTCAATDSIPIMYGKPADELVQQADRGEVILGGCVPHREDRHCRSCGHEWQTPDHPLLGGLGALPSRQR